jgi:hypothetical protein
LFGQRQSEKSGHIDEDDDIREDEHEKDKGGKGD